MKSINKNELKTKNIILIITSVSLLIIGILFFLEDYISFIDGDKIFYVVMLLYFGLEFTNYLLTKKMTGMNSLYISLVRLMASVSGILYGSKDTSLVITITLGCWMFAMLIIKLIRIENLRNNLNVSVFVNLFTMSMFILLGFLTLVNIYKEISNITMMLGFFFVVYGILNLIETIANIKLCKIPLN